MKDLELLNKKPTQCDRVLQYMRDFGSITTLQAFIDLGVVRLGARISEMRKAGLNIQDRPKEVLNRYGDTCHIKEYFINEQLTLDI